MLVSQAPFLPDVCVILAYHAILPFYLNVITTTAVTLINAGIGYTAIVGLIIEFRHHRSQTIRCIETIVRIIGLLIGILSSLAACMAAIHGLTKLFIAASMNRIFANNLAILIGWSVWVPVAALYANTTQILASNLYHFFF